MNNVFSIFVFSYACAYFMAWAFRKDLREVNAILSEIFSVIKLFCKLVYELLAASVRVVMQFMVIKGVK